MATKASRIALAGSNISSTGEVDADLLDNIDSAAFLSLDSNGRLGIGTASPDRALTIEGSDFASSSIRLKRTGGGANNDAGLQFQSAAGANAGAGMGGIWFQNSLDGNAYSLIRARTDDATGTSGRLDFMTSTSTVSNSTTPSLTIKSTGNVGIGTTSPNARLDVNGLIKGIAGASSSGGIKLHTNSGINVSANVMSFHTGQTNGFSFNGNSDGADSSNPLVVIRADGSVKVKNAADDASQFIFNDGWSSEARNIRVWAEEEVSGGIGRWFSFLGTNVSKDGDGTYTKPSDDSASNWGNIAGMLFTGANAAGQNAIDFIVDLPSAHGGGLNAGMSGSNLYNKSAMSITAGSKVGIGTASPIDKLNVHYTSTETHNTTLTKGTNTQGIWVTNQQNTNNMAGIHLATGGGTHFSSIVGCRTNNNAHWGTHLSFYTHDDNASNLNTANEKMRIHGCGAVTTPQQPIGSFSDSRTTSVSNGILDSSNFYNKTWLNQGNHMNFSNGRFTCPVAGIYRIYFRATGSGNSNVRLRKNGGTINEAYEATGTNHSVSSEAVIPCSAGDYLEIQCSSSNFLTGTQHKQVTFELIS